MDISTLEELLDSLRENVENELESEGLGSWTINTSGQNFVDNLNQFSIEELKDLQTELREGAKAEVTIDLAEHILDHVNEVIREHDNYQDDDDEDDYGVEELDFDDDY